MRVFFEFRPLAEPCRPVHVTRDGGDTLVAVDPRSERLDAVKACVELMTVEEQNLAREAWGMPPVGEPMPDTIVEPGPVLTWLPESLRTADYATPDRRTGCPLARELYDLARDHRPA